GDTLLSLRGNLPGDAAESRARPIRSSRGGDRDAGAQVSRGWKAMTGDSQPPLSSDKTAPVPERTDRSVVTQFFLLPLAVVGGLVGVFLLFTRATRRPPTAEDYLRTLRTGRFNQRWQAAFELSNLIKDMASKDADTRLQGELVEVFKESMADKD